MTKLSKTLSTELKIAALASVVLLAGGCATAKKGEMAEPAAPAMKVVVTEKVLDATELFEFNSAELSSGGMSTLDELVQMAGGAAVGNITVIGHADRIGSDEYNMDLSQRRASAVADYMVSKGVASGSISSMGKGESEPVVQCDSEPSWKALIDCLAPNRRVVVQYPIQIEEEVMMEN